MASKQFVIFNVNNEDFGIEIGQVSSIEKPLEIFKVPNTPHFIEGLINLRGKVYTVFNLRKKFDLPFTGMDENTKIVIVNVNSTMAGFIVDEVKEILKIEDADIEETPKSISGINREYLTGVAKVGEKIVLLLDLSKILSSEDKKAMENLQNVM